MFRLSYGDRNTKQQFNINSEGMRQKSYSSVKLFAGATTKTGINNNVDSDNNTLLNNKLRTRGLSFAKLPTKLHR